MENSNGTTSHAEQIIKAVAESQKTGTTPGIAAQTTEFAEAPNTANGFKVNKEALNETNVASEVDRILNSINVNSFITETKPTPSEPKPSVPEINSQDTPSTKDGETKVADIPAVTSILADFVAAAKPSLLTPEIRAQLQECLLDFIAVTAAGAQIAPSSQPILQGLLAFSNAQSLPDSKACTVISQDRTQPAHYAAFLNATYGHSLDFDDTHAESSLHAGVTAIATALAEAESLNRTNTTPPTSDDVLLAILLGYETTIRIGLALSTASYSRGFHMTSTAGIFGSVAVIASLRRLSPTTLINAWGLAGSKAAGSMQYLANGSHNKRLHPGFAAHDAFLCASLAQAGVIGADKIIEGDLGLLQAYTDRDRASVDWARLVSRLGDHWEFSDSALKPYAGCRMTHAFIELADSLGRRLRAGDFADRAKNVRVSRIRCAMPAANMILIGQRTPNKVHPENMVDAQFSCYFQVANAVFYGGTHDMAAYDRLDDKSVREMCERVECVVDESVTKMGAKMDVFLDDGEGEVVDVVRRELKEPLGERSNPFERAKVEKKFMGLMVPVFGEERAGEVLRRVGEFGGEGEGGAGGVLQLMDLLAT